MAHVLPFSLLLPLAPLFSINLYSSFFPEVNKSQLQMVLQVNSVLLMHEHRKQPLTQKPPPDYPS
ncbi:hypothetical protein I79_021703 [Cricetulus griseus]|uniref:Uncharacterized protein n=1 Tax=Cricetulus griseus TaxID=10029 RepID=G3IDC7_CRIGR|nr:hypothetical protein I79_021703 [Cricetulus griseus]